MLTLRQSHVDQMYAQAREAFPAECCGLIGGTQEKIAQNVYPLRNISSTPLVAYEAAPEELFGAQREMRERSEQLLAIYHSHPRSGDPVPSDSDVRLAYYPSAIYIIIGMHDLEPSLRAFHIDESAGSWKAAQLVISAN